MAQWVVGADFKWRDGLILKQGKLLDDNLYPDVQLMIAKGANIVPATAASLAQAALALLRAANGQSVQADVAAHINLAEQLDGPPGLQAPGTLSLAAGGSIVVPAAQYILPSFAVGGTLPSNTTLVFPTTLGPTAWTVDASTVTFSGFTLTLQVNGNNWGTVLSAQGVASVYFNGTKFFGGTLTP